MGSDCLKPFRAPGLLPPSFVDLGKTSKSAVISPCLSDVIVNGWERSGARLEPIPAALEKRSSLLYNTEILILPRLCATGCRKGKSRSTLHFSFLICFALLSTCSPYCLLQFALLPDPYHYISVLCRCIYIFAHFLLPYSPFPFSFQSSSFSQASFFASCCGVTDGTWGWSSLPGKGQKPRDLIICRKEVAAMQDFQCLLH